jgi:hypothetical protein
VTHTKHDAGFANQPFGIVATSSHLPQHHPDIEKENTVPTNNGKDGYIANSRSTRRAWSGMIRHAEITGAKIEPRWESFGAFLDDMSYRPEGTVLRRHDESKGFYPSNCAWV